VANGNITVRFEVHSIKEYPIPRDRPVLVYVEAGYNGMCWTEIEWVAEWDKFDFPVDTENMVDIDSVTHWCELPVIKE